MDDTDFVAAAIKRVKNIVELNAGQAEDGIDALGSQCVDEIFGAGYADLRVHSGNLIVAAAASNAIR